MQKQGLAEGIRADSDPVVNGNSGVLAISATLTDKGLAHRDEVTAAIFSYLRPPAYSGRRADGTSTNWRMYWRWISAIRRSTADMDYVEWLADRPAIRVPRSSMRWTW
ncbi:hypothetical protein MJ588_23115 [Klebsiella pneumoniae]|nr:hypothetical protein MJ588_23115 [Klebsiella pneumoniae]